jgi:SAM-dependent methyltransferase
MYNITKESDMNDLVTRLRETTFQRYLPLSSAWNIGRLLRKKEYSFLDVGCGNGSGLDRFVGKFTLNITGIDIFQPYINKLKNTGRYVNLVIGDIRYLPFKPKSFNSILCTEVIEHLTKDEGLHLLSQFEIVARKSIIITTPSGFLKRQKHDGNLHQLHISGWSPQDFIDLGYKVIPCVFRYPIPLEEENLFRFFIRHILTYPLYPFMLMNVNLCSSMICIKNL